MSRLPYAAEQLIAQVTEAKPRAKVERVGEPDGLDVNRTIKFNKSTANWLIPLLEEIDDPRIEDFDAEEGTVTFVGTPNADSRDRFPLEAAETTTSAPAEQSD